MPGCYSAPECYSLFSGVKLTIKSSFIICHHSAFQQRPGQMGETGLVLHCNFVNSYCKFTHKNRKIYPFTNVLHSLFIIDNLNSVESPMSYQVDRI